MLFHTPRRADIRQKNQDRADAIKAQINVADLARALVANVTARPPAGQGSGPDRLSCDCPACGAGGSVSISADRQRWGCTGPSACRASGDVVTFQMAATGRDFLTACTALEARLAAAPRANDTPDLFAPKTEGESDGS